MQFQVASWLEILHKLRRENIIGFAAGTELQGKIQLPGMWFPSGDIGGDHIAPMFILWYDNAHWGAG